MDPLTALLVPVAKGFVSVLSGTAILGCGGYYVHRKFIAPFPLVNFLSKVTEKKFTYASLVSHIEHGNGVSTFKLKIPTGYSVEDMLKLKPAIEDKLDCEIQVWAEDKNFVLEVCENPIPKYIEFIPAEVKEKLQEYECAMYLGESRKGSVFLDFTKPATPHLLFGGPTGGGKSNLINQGLCGMIEAYSPEELNLYLIDLKDGVELAPYEDVEHVKGFYENVDDVYDGLQRILLELKRRNNLFKRTGVKTLSDYNKKSTKKLPRILVVADEFAQFNNIADREFKKEVYSKWEEILQKGRSTGIHVIVGTQIADADVFPKQIKGNIDARFGFKFTDIQHSKMITGGSELTYLPNIQGRGLYKLGSQLIQTQTPYISSTTLEQVLEKYRVAKPITVEETKERITVEEPKETKQLPIINREENGIEDLFVSEETFLQQIPATAK